MSPDYKNQLERLKNIAPPFELVKEEVRKLHEGTERSKGIVMAYFYPLALTQGYNFFAGDEETANQAAFELMEHLVEGQALSKFKGKDEQLASFFTTAARNFFLNHYNRELQTQPDIRYGHEAPDVVEDDYSDTDELTHLQGSGTTHSGLLFAEPYPYDGIDTDDPETLAIKKEESALVGHRVAAIREALYPADKEVFDLLLEEYTSDEVAEALGRTVVGIENSIRRIRAVVSTHG